MIYDKESIPLQGLPGNMQAAKIICGLYNTLPLTSVYTDYFGKILALGDSVEMVLRSNRRELLLIDKQVKSEIGTLDETVKWLASDIMSKCYPPWLQFAAMAFIQNDAVTVVFGCKQIYKQE